MTRLKTNEEIEIMKEGGKRLRKIVKFLLQEIEAGKSTKFVDEQAEKLIYKFGGEPSFKKVKNYYWSTCLPINQQIVHSPPSSRIIKEGDLLTLDIGFYYKGFNTDFATTTIIGKNDNEKISTFLDVGKLALKKAIDQVKPGNNIGNISVTINKEINSNGYFILKPLTGHGIGRELHEDPYIPGFLDIPIGKTLKIKPGLTIAIEVIYSIGTEEITYESGNDWSIVTKDGSLSACFEHTVAVTDKRTLILT